MGTMNFEEILKDPQGAEIEAKLAHLPEAERDQARWNLGAQNLIDFGDLAEIGKVRLFDEDESAEFTEALSMERWAGNEAAVTIGREVAKIQGKFLKAALKAEKKAGKAPENIRDFEAGLKKMGFTTRAAKKIAVEGFKSGVAETVTS